MYTIHICYPKSRVVYVLYRWLHTCIYIHLYVYTHVYIYTYDICALHIQVKENIQNPRLYIQNPRLYMMIYVQYTYMSCLFYIVSGSVCSVSFVFSVSRQHSPFAQLGFACAGCWCEGDSPHIHPYTYIHVYVYTYNIRTTFIFVIDSLAFCIFSMFLIFCVFGIVCIFCIFRIFCMFCVFCIETTLNFCTNLDLHVQVADVNEKVRIYICIYLHVYTYMYTYIRMIYAQYAYLFYIVSVSVCSLSFWSSVSSVWFVFSVWKQHSPCVQLGFACAGCSCERESLVDRDCWLQLHCFRTWSELLPA